MAHHQRRPSAPPPQPDPAPTPPDVTIVKPTKDTDGNEWTTEPAAGGVHVTLRTKAGRQCSCTAPTEDEARAAITAHLTAEAPAPALPQEE